jgi:hypothetical protein
VSKRVLHATMVPLLVMRPQEIQSRPQSQGEEEIVVIETTEIHVETSNRQS